MPEVKADGGQQCVGAITCAASQPVASEQSVVLSVTDNWFHYGRPFQPAFDFFRHATFLSGDVNRGVRLRDAMSLVSFVDRHTLRRTPHELANVFQCCRQCVAVVGILVQRLRMENEVPALGRMQISGQGDFATKLVRRAPCLC